MAVQKRVHLPGRDRLADRIGYVDGIEVAGVREPVHRGEVDMVRVHEVRLPPSTLPDSGVGFLADSAGLRPDNSMLPVGLVPHRRHGNPVFRGQDARPQLRAPLPPEPVAHAQGELADPKRGLCKVFRHEAASLPDHRPTRDEV